MRNLTSALACAGIALLISACGGGGGSTVPRTPTNPPTTNVAPTANAGAAQSVQSGVTVTLNGSQSSDSDGTVASYAWSQTGGAALALSSATTASPTFTAPAVATATLYTFSLVVTDNAGAASTASSVVITVNPLVAGNSLVTGRITFGRVPFATSSPFGLNYGGVVQRPSRGITVNALAAGTATVLATATTNDNGEYSLSVTSNTNISLQVLAQLRRTGAAPTWNVRVANGVGGTTYAHDDATTFNSSAGTPRDIAIPTGINASGTATGTRASGPFAILDTTYQAIQTVLSVAPSTAFPDLLVDWGSQSDGTFFDSGGTQRIALLGDLNADTDEFDTHVIAHEFGHYIEYNFSRADNIGGAHGIGDKLDPRVAFGEGFGYAFAAIVMNDPIARDSFTDVALTRCGQRFCAGTFNIETNPASSSLNASPAGNFGSWSSESSVWSILWDVYDTAADTNDNVALGFAPIWQVLTGEQRTTPAFTTLFSFITALKTGRSTAELNAINALVNAQNTLSTTINAFATTETNVPSPLLAADILPVYTTITRGGGAVTVRSVDDEGDLYNSLGNRHYLRFTSNVTGSVTLSVTTSNANAAEADPDFFVWTGGDLIAVGQNFGATEDETFNVVNGRTYVIDAFECANGCDSEQGTPGDYTLTVTLN